MLSVTDHLNSIYSHNNVLKLFYDPSRLQRCERDSALFNLFCFIAYIDKSKIVFYRLFHIASKIIKDRGKKIAKSILCAFV